MVEELQLSPSAAASHNGWREVGKISKLFLSRTKKLKNSGAEECSLPSSPTHRDQTGPIPKIPLFQNVSAEGKRDNWRYQGAFLCHKMRKDVEQTLKILTMLEQWLTPAAEPQPNLWNTPSHTCPNPNNFFSPQVTNAALSQPCHAGTLGTLQGHSIAHREQAAASTAWHSCTRGCRVVFS